MFLITACALIALLLRPEKLDRGYFPIDVGFRWVYEAVQGGQGEVVFEVTGKQQIGDTDCFVVLRTIGSHELKFYVEVTLRGVFIHQVGEDRYVPAYKQFAFASQQSDQWEWKGQVGGEPAAYECYNTGLQTCEVPLGSWESYRVHQRIPTTGADTYFSLADEVGVIKIYSKNRDEHDPPAPEGQSETFEWQLKEFTRS